MADQAYIKKTVEELSAKFKLAQEEVISTVLKIVKGKSNAEAIAILNELDIGAVISAKTSGIKTAYTAGNAGILLSKEKWDYLAYLKGSLQGS